MKQIFAVVLGLATALAAAVTGVGCSHDSKKEATHSSSRTLAYSSAIEEGGPGLVDIYEPPASVNTNTPISSQNRPAIVVIHGGTWRSGDKQDVSGVASEFAAQGYVAFAPNYSLAPKVEFPAPVLDLQSLLRYMRSNSDQLGIDPKRIGAWGSDAGGHLATMLALRDDPLVATGSTSSSGSTLAEVIASTGRVRCAVDAYGPADLSIPNGLGPAEDQILRDFLGGVRYQLTTSQLLAASTIGYARPDASVLIVHGTADPFVSIDHSEHLYNALSDAKADVSFIRVYGGLHDASTYHSSEAWAAALQLFSTHIGPASSF